MADTQCVACSHERHVNVCMETVDGATCACSYHVESCACLFRFDTDEIDRAVLEADTQITASILKSKGSPVSGKTAEHVGLVLNVLVAATAWREADQQTDEEEYILRCDALGEAVDALNEAEESATK